MEIPFIYALDRLARRWGVAPWLLDTDDPEISRWIHRGLLFERFEADATAKKR